MDFRRLYPGGGLILRGWILAATVIRLAALVIDGALADFRRYPWRKTGNRTIEEGWIVMRRQNCFILWIGLGLTLAGAGHALGDEVKVAEGTPADTKGSREISIFPDKNLEAVVRRSVFSKRGNDEPLTAKDVEKVSTIEGKGKGIRDLRGLEACVSLALLDLEDNDIADIDPIMELTRLQSINLAKNRIGDLTAIKKLDRIQYLHLADNRIVDLEPLSGLRNLRTLYLSNNKVRDLSPIASLEKIWSLSLDGNRVASLDPIRKMKWLSSLDVRGNGLSDIKPIVNLSELKYLVIENNQLKELSPLVEMAKADAEGDRRFSPFWRIYLAGNPLEDDAKESIAEIVKLGGRVFDKPVAD